jgi:hypothetical protein
MKHFRAALLCMVFLVLAHVAWATTSTIDPTQPSQASYLTSSVLRANFLAAYNDINNLYTRVAAFIGSSTTGQLIFNNAGVAGGITVSGDCTLNTMGGGAITCTKTNGNSFVASATTDTTNADNIISGTINSARLPPSTVPAPTTSALGGLFAKATATAHQVVQYIDTTGTQNLTQLGFTDLSGSVASTQMPAITGDVSTSAGATASTLATVNSNTGTFGDATHSAGITLNGKGLAMAATSNLITPAWSNVQSTPTTRAGYGITDALSNASTISAGGPTGSGVVVPVLTWNATGQLTAIGTATIAPPFSAITSKPTTIAGYGITDTLSQTLAGFTSTTGTVTSADTILTSLEKIYGNAAAAVSGVSSVSGDGVLINNSSSTGGVTLSLATATAHKFWGNNTGSTGAPGYVSIGTADVPTLNQNTTGSAATLTTARTLAGNSFNGSANVPFANAFIVQGTADSGLTGAQFLGALGTGIVKNTTTTGALTIAVAGDFPTLNQNTTGTAATVTGATQSSITSAPNLATIGTIGTGVWNGTRLTSSYIPTDVDYIDVAQTFTAAKTFTNSDLLILGSSTGATTVTSDNAGASNFTMHLPAANDTIADLAGAQTFTNKSINASNNTLTNIGTSNMGGFTGTPSSTTFARGDGTWSAVSGMVYPGSGIPNSTGSAWGTSYSTSGTGTTVALTASPTFTGTVSGAAATWSGSDAANDLVVTGTSVPTIGANAQATNTLGLWARSLVSATFTNVASAVNYFAFSGAATGTGPSITAAGTDTDISPAFNSAGLGVPSINGDKRYDANMDASKFNNLRGCIANVTGHGTGAGQNCIIFALGTSLTSGVLNGANDAPTPSPPSQLAAMLNASGIPTSTDSFFGDWNTTYPRSTYDKRLIVGSDWTANTTYQSAGGNQFLATSGGSNPLQFTPGWVDKVGTLHPDPIDTCKVYFLQYPVTQSFSLAFDNGSAATTNGNAADGLGVATISGQLGTHTLKINWVSGNPSIIGAICYNSAIPQILMVNGGWPGATAANWLQTNFTGANDPWAPGNFATSLGAQFVMVELGGNEIINSVSSSTFAANLATVLTQNTSSTMDESVQSIDWFNPSTYPGQAPYIEAIRTAAGTTTPYIGVAERFGSTQSIGWNNENATNTVYVNVGDGYGGVHFTVAGQHEVAEMEKAALAPVINIGGEGNSMLGGTAPPLMANGGTTAVLQPHEFADNRLEDPFMEVDQANEGASVSLSSTVAAFATGMWQCKFSSANFSAVSCQQSTDAPQGYYKSLKYLVGTGSGTLSAGDYAILFQDIDGLDAADLGYGVSGGRYTSASCWMRTNKTGNYSIWLANASLGSSWNNTFTMNTSGVWQNVAFDSIPADTAGTWTTATGATGITFGVTLAAGSTWQGTANAWNNGGLTLGTSGNANLGANSGNYFEITGCKFAPEFTHTTPTRKTFAEQLENDRRFYRKTFPQGTAPAQNAGLPGALSTETEITTSTSAGYYWQFDPPMAKSPTITTDNPSAGNANWRDKAGSADVTVAVDPDTAKGTTGVLISTTGTLTAAHKLYIHAVADGRF